MIVPWGSGRCAAYAVQGGSPPPRTTPPKSSGRVLPRIAAALLFLACAHGTQPDVPRAVPGPTRAELTTVALAIVPDTVVNDPVLKDRGNELRAALAQALPEEGFRLEDRAGALAVTTSIDYTPWTAVSAASLYVVVGLKSEGVAVDQVEVQKINEAFPEAAKVGELAHALAHALATSPRLKEFLTPPKN